MPDTAHGLHMQCAGYQCSQRAASHMVKGKNHYKAMLSPPCYLRHEHALPAVRDRGTSTTRGPTPGSQHQLPRPCQDSDPEETQAFGRMATAPLSPAPKAKASRHVMGATVTQQLLQQDVSSCSRKKGRAKNTSEKVQTQTPTNGAKSSKKV